MRAGRWQAFLAKPTLARLLDVWDAAPDEKEQVDLMSQAAQYLQSYLAHPPRERGSMEFEWREDDLEQTAWVNKSELAHAYQLAGEWGAAHETAAREKTLGWSSGDSAQGLVLPFFLVLLSGKAAHALPANLAQQWQTALQNSVGSGYYGDGSQDEDNVLKRLQRVYADKLAGASIASSQQKEILSWCQRVVKQRTDDIVGNQHRGSYGKAAVLTAACAETLQSLGKKLEADLFLEDARNRFPRHRAFQAELDTATERMGRGSKRKGNR